jgi:hypothetical protein
MTEPCPAYDEKLYKCKRKFDEEKNRPIKHSRWNRHSNVPRYSKPQEKWFGNNMKEQEGWHKGARVYA